MQQSNELNQPLQPSPEAAQLDMENAQASGASFSMGSGKQVPEGQTYLEGLKDQFVDKAKDLAITAALTFVPGGLLAKTAAKICLNHVMDKNGVNNEMVIGGEEHSNLSGKAGDLLANLGGENVNKPSKGITSQFSAFSQSASSVVENTNHELERGAFNEPIPTGMIR